MQLIIVTAPLFRYRELSIEKKYSTKFYSYFFQKQKEPITELEKLFIPSDEKACDGKDSE